MGAFDDGVDPAAPSAPRGWRVGTDADVAWIQQGTSLGRSIASAVPPLFGAYATIVVPNAFDARCQHLEIVLQLLREHSGEQAWWLGYLETGADDVVLPAAPRVTLYAGWPYVVVQAGPDQASAWRRDARSWRAPGPDLLFPHDRTWLMSWLWDDDWRCLGGPTELIERFVRQPRLDVRQVDLGDDATPPGHVSY